LIRGEKKTLGAHVAIMGTNRKQYVSLSMGALIRRKREKRIEAAERASMKKMESAH